MMSRLSDNCSMPSETEQRRWIEQWQAAREALRLQPCERAGGVVR